MSEEFLQKAKRTGNRAIITKLMKESDNTKKERQEHGLPLDSSSTSRLHTIYAMLKGKISTANDLDEQVCLYVVEQRILRCKLKCYVKPMKNPLGISTSRGNQGTTTSGLNLPLLCGLSYKVGQTKSGMILGGESWQRESRGTYECCAL